MPKVQVLDKELSELIAAGEVIERPCSVIKELVENSIDSGAKTITVEIKRGGISYIRITDNGCAMSHEDVPTAFLRHATSKLKNKDDLSRIMTLGFRGEALASISAVARCEVLTKPAGEMMGTHYVIEGTEERLYEKTGCPDGTTIIIRDIFYNVPARLKFLKKDQYEGNAIASIITKIAVSHPDISFRFIRDNRQELFTPGDGKLYSALYSVFGKEFAASLLEVSYSLNGIRIYGYTVKPLWGRKNRTMQHFFVNGRYIRSLTCMSSLEEAYRNTIMEGKFPACVIFMEVPPDTVDVNVHPAKTEIRFSDDKRIYDAVYFAVRNAILQDQKPAELKMPEHKKTEADYAMPVFKDPPKPVQTVISDTSVSKLSDSAVIKEQPSRQQFTTAEDMYKSNTRLTDVPVKISGYSDNRRSEQSEEHTAEKVILPWEKPAAPKPKPSDVSEHIQSGYSEKNTSDNDCIDNIAPQPKQEFKYIDSSQLVKKEQETPVQREEPPAQEIFFRLIGEAFKNYAIAEVEDGILVVDKHAAHERIRFERLRTGKEDLSAQMLLAPEELILDYSEYDALSKNIKLCFDCGFEIELLKAPRVLVKGIPSVLDKNSASDIVTELAQNFAAHRHDPLPEILDDMYHTMACRGAIKANDITSPEELKSLIKQILADERIRYCPHGRPVMFKLTKKELEKQFRRIV